MARDDKQQAERGRGRRFGGILAVWVLNAAIVGAALGLYFLVLGGQAPLAVRHTVPWWALAPAFAATEVFVRLFRNESTRIWFSRPALASVVV